jgi:hypothetical protein
MAKSLKTAIRETREYLELNCDLMSECGKDNSGGCSLAGTEYCDWECPFS